MEENPNTTASETPEMPNLEVLAEYRFIITFETYPNRVSVSAEEQHQVMGQIDKALGKEFADEVEFLFGGMVKARVGPLDVGSIFGSVTLVLAGAIAVAEFISKYKDFYESLVLLRNQLRAILNRVLHRELKEDVFRTVNVTFVPGPATRVVPVIQSMSRQGPLPAFYSKAFFIYLLVMNIVLAIIIFALVYHAVIAMYFSTP
jgi:hypothetical protein